MNPVDYPVFCPFAPPASVLFPQILRLDLNRPMLSLIDKVPSRFFNQFFISSKCDLQAVISAGLGTSLLGDDIPGEMQRCRSQSSRVGSYQARAVTSLAKAMESFASKWSPELA